MADTGLEFARGRPEEAVGARPHRAKAKRREAFTSGELAASSEARFPLETWAYGRRDGCEIGTSYLVRSAGLRASGSAEDQ